MFNKKEKKKLNKQKATKKESLLSRLFPSTIEVTPRKPKKKKVDLDTIIKKAKESQSAELQELAIETEEAISQIDEQIAKIEKNERYYLKKQKEGKEFLESKISGLEDSIEKYTELNKSILKKSNVRKISVTKNYSLLKLRKAIESFGFEVNPIQIILIMVVSMAVPAILGVVSKLQTIYIAVLAVAGFIASPTIISIYYRQKYITRKFQMIIDYLTNLIPMFMQTKKITATLSQLSESTNGESIVKWQMKEALDDALMYIRTNTDDVDATHTALEMIEQEFPNSRIKSAHRLMETVEAKNSNNDVIKGVCESMFEDIAAWVSRVNTFQADLNDRRKKIILLCAMTVGMNCVFVYLYTGTEYFAGFTDNVIYQITVVLFIIAIIVIALITLSKLNGSWLLDDATDNQDVEIKKAYNTWDAGKQKPKKAEIGMGIIFMGAGVYFLMMPSYPIAAICLVMAVLMYTTQPRKYKSAYSKLNKHFELEFPSWMRDITLNIYTDTVINAIDASRMSCSYPLYRQLSIFISEVRQNPTSIVPYSNLLKDFDCKDVQTSIKVLYSIQTYGQAQIEGQIASLTRRTQDMLNKSETLKNESRLRSVEMLGYAPMGAFAIAMLVDMVLLFMHIMNIINSAMGGMGGI